MGCTEGTILFSQFLLSSKTTELTRNHVHGNIDHCCSNSLYTYNTRSSLVKSDIYKRILFRVVWSIMQKGFIKTSTGETKNRFLEKSVLLSNGERERESCNFIETSTYISLLFCFLLSLIFLACARMWFRCYILIYIGNKLGLVIRTVLQEVRLYNK